MRRANKGVLPSVLGVDGYNPSVGAKADPDAAPAEAAAVATATVAAPTPSASAAAPVLRSSTAPAGPASMTANSKETRELALQKIDAALGTISRYRTGGDGGQALKMLILYVQNIAQNPAEAK